jgi:hypothetical protein
VARQPRRPGTVIHQDDPLWTLIARTRRLRFTAPVEESVRCCMAAASTYVTSNGESPVEPHHRWTARAPVAGGGQARGSAVIARAARGWRRSIRRVVPPRCAGELMPGATPIARCAGSVRRPIPHFRIIRGGCPRRRSMA